jgi:hypothetical protein
MAARLYAGLESLSLIIDTPYDSIRTSDVRDDLIGVKVWYSTTSGFNPPSQGILAYDGSGLNITINGPLADATQKLAKNTTYYVKYALISSIEPEVIDVSAQLTATTTEGVSLLTLDTTDWAFIYKDSLATTPENPASITFTAVKQNLTGTPTFTAVAYNSSNVNLGNVTLTGTGDVRVLTAANFNALGPTTVRYVKVTVTLGTLSDVTTIFRGDNGSDALTFILTNESHTVPAANDGFVTSYSGAVTYGAIFRGITNETNLWTITKTDSTGLTTTLQGTSAGVNNITVTATALSDAIDNATCTITATRTDYPTLSKVFSISKSKAGANGGDGINTATIALYNKNTSNSSAPSSFSGTFTYTFSTAALTGGTLNGWSTTAPSISNGEYLWVRYAVASSNIATDTILDTEFSSAVVSSVGGVNGSNGINTATIALYNKNTSNSSAPSSFSGTFTYTFSTAALTGGTLNGWSTTAPSISNGEYLWVRYAVASSNTATDTILDTEFSSAVINGIGGINGTRTAILDMYRSSSSTPTTFPSGDSTYTWATGQFTAPATTNGWSITPPTPVAGEILYIVRQLYSDSATTATTSITWSSTTALSISSSGNNGARTAFLEVYQWAASTPTTFPSGTSIYTWATGSFTAPTTANGWSLLPGASTPGYNLYACSVRYTDTSTAATSTVTWNTSTAYVVGSAGINGIKGDKGDQGDPGNPGSTGLQGIRSITAYRVRNQTDSPLTTAPSDTSGATAPTDYSLTASSVTVGQVLWYSFGRYNPNASAVEGIPANTTVWSVPIAASIFQDIRSDNYNGPNPPTSADFGTTGYYFRRSTGELFATSAYLRGQLVTGTSGAQRIEINLSNNNRLKALSSSNTELISIGGTGNNTEPNIVVNARPITDGTLTYGVGQAVFLTNYDSSTVPTGSTFGTAIKTQQSDFSSVAELCSYYKSGTAAAESLAVYGSQVNYSTETPSLIHVGTGALGYWSAAGWCVGGLFEAAYTGSNGNVAEVRLADPNNGYAIHLVTGAFRWGSVTISAPPNNTTQVLIGNGTWTGSPQLVNPAASGGYYGINAGVSKKILDYDNSAMATIVGREITNGGFVVTSNAVRPLQLRSTAVTDLGTTSGGDYTFRNFGWGGYVIPPPPGGTGSFLRSDGTWAAASTSSLPSGGTTGQFLRGDGTWSNTLQGSLLVTGEVTAYSGSDIVLKQDIVRIPNALEKVLSLGGYNFTWTDKHLQSLGSLPENYIKRDDVGIIAQQVLGVLPQAVVTRDDGILAVNYTKLIPLIIEAIIELHKKVSK